MTKQRIVIIGPAHPLRGGLATFNQRLAKEFISMGHECSIYSFSLQYPSFLFPGTTQYSDDPAPDLDIHTRINSVNPLNWISVGRELRKYKPDLVVVRFWLPFMGPALGTILRQVRKNKHTRIIAITDNVIPHEKRPGDKQFTKYFLRACHGFITMSEKVLQDLRTFEPYKPARQLLHPLYDNFGEAISKDVAKAHLGLGQVDKIVLFFGFIRKYKGLDILLRAMKEMKDVSKDPTSLPKLLIAGEFYEDESFYSDLIKELGIADLLILRTNFISDLEVRYYLCASDVVIQPYRNATQSGVTPLAYHYERPMIVTNVGGLPDLVPDRQVGLVCEPEPRSIADAIGTFYELGEDFFIAHLRTEKQRYSWSNLANAILQLPVSSNVK
ncbi:MAG TPA: glycosyltransferase [Flavitalea sp.]|nr:glycosyltransferase [Flavitalea sp.]